MPDWTVQTLKEHIEKLFVAMDDKFSQRFDDSSKAVNAALAATKEAVSKAEIATEKRFEGVNEFRNTLSDQQRTLMPRSESEALMKNMNEKIGELSAGRDKSDGRTTGRGDALGYIVGAVGIISAIITIFLKL